MNKYSPFLKFKNGEITALSKLSPNEKKMIIPLLELPRDSRYNEDELINTIANQAKKFKKYIETSFVFYIDNYEISDDIKINGEDNYKYLLDSFSEYNLIPIIGLDRTDEHNNIAIDFANKISAKIGIRITQEYFASFPAYNEDFKNLFTQINHGVSCDILLDCNYIDDSNIHIMERHISNIIKDMFKIYQFENIVISGSSIPMSKNIGSIVKTNTNVRIPRNEVNLFRNLKNKFSKITFTFGDYTVISPGYSEIDIDPKKIHLIMTSKIIYSELDSHYFTRGNKLWQYGFEQYFSQAEDIINQPFFRGENYSCGDKFLYDKATFGGTNITPATIIAPEVNAHITFMINEITKGSI